MNYEDFKSHVQDIHIAAKAADNEIVELDPTDPFESVLIEIVEMNRRKRADYAKDDDPFSNFRFTASLFDIKPEEAALFNVAQKLARLSTLRVKEEVQNEPVEDTYLDMAVYAIIAYAIYKEWLRNDEP